MDKRLTRQKNSIGLQPYWQINKCLAKKLGLIPTLLLSHLEDLLYNYPNMPDEFYQQYDRLTDSLGLSKHKIQKAVDVLKKKGLISVEIKGMPAKNHFTLHPEAIDELLESENYLAASHQKIERLATKKFSSKYREKETEKKEYIPPRAADKSSKRSKRKIGEQIEQASALHELDSLGRWQQLLSVWKTTETSPSLKVTFKKYFLPLGKVKQEELVNIVISLGPDVKFLNRNWIGTYFKQNCFDRKTLLEDILKNKELHRPTKKDVDDFMILRNPQLEPPKDYKTWKK